MSYSEAVEAVGKLIGAFPNGSPSNAKGYIGALAAVLVDYPRVVSTKCADPLHGVARETRFLPTVADLVGWCERERQSLQQIVDRDDFNRAVREDMKRLAAEADQIAAARQTRPTLQQMKDKYGENWGISSAEKEDLQVKAARLGMMARANSAAFEAECTKAGLPLDSIASPSLIRLLTDQGAITTAPQREAAE